MKTKNSLNNLIKQKKKVEKLKQSKIVLARINQTIQKIKICKKRKKVNKKKASKKKANKKTRKLKQSNQLSSLMTISNHKKLTVLCMNKSKSKISINSYSLSSSLLIRNNKKGPSKLKIKLCSKKKVNMKWSILQGKGPKRKWKWTSFNIKTRKRVKLSRKKENMSNRKICLLVKVVKMK